MTSNERDQKIIQQAKIHLRTIANSSTLRERVMEAVEANTLQAYWELQTDLTEGSKVNGNEIKNRLVDYRGNSNAILFVQELAKILRGEYLEENK
jgi:hypothetical protein